MTKSESQADHLETAEDFQKWQATHADKLNAAEEHLHRVALDAVIRCVKHYMRSGMSFPDACRATRRWLTLRCFAKQNVDRALREIGWTPADRSKGGAAA